LRSAFANPGLTTDLIVGFPGETQEEFSQTLGFIRACAFSAMHIFPYSKRPGTPAAARKDQIPNAVKQQRAHEAAQLAARMSAQYLQLWVGQRVDVLFEQGQNGLWRGYTTRYVEVGAFSRENLHNRLRTVCVEGVEDGALRGRLASGSENK
jgi:threonylcarbamoyladenosine tRNA methylthiotransferase MtaB